MRDSCLVPILTLKCNPKTGEIILQTRLKSSRDDGVSKNNYHNLPVLVMNIVQLILFKTKVSTVIEKYSIFLNPIRIFLLSTALCKK